MATQAAIGVGAALPGLGASSADMTGTVYESLIATKLSRVDEAEADRSGAAARLKVPQLQVGARGWPPARSCSRQRH